MDLSSERNYQGINGIQFRVGTGIETLEGDQTRMVSRHIEKNNSGE